MGSKTLILFGILAFVAIAQCKPPFEIGIIRFVPVPPPFDDTRGVVCTLGEDVDICQQKHAVQLKQNNQKELAHLNKWIDGLDEYGKANWQKHHALVAQRYKELLESV
ncbi:unnamed protein product [Orchesella dallaii]|uniref:Uncharacterized protein n=1 Tax=Orchesella dallaii TaxID=48710 RepID=A0ABP1RPU5_9HEXA